MQVHCNAYMHSIPLKGAGMLQQLRRWKGILTGFAAFCCYRHTLPATISRASQKHDTVGPHVQHMLMTA